MKPNFKLSHKGQAQNRTAVVFVHGILSSCEKCFKEMQAAIIQADTTGLFDIWHYDYDFHLALTHNGERLAEYIQTQLSDTYNYDRIHIVAHSMGGLVSRIALMHRKLTKVEKLILLGTPNHGAFAPSQLSLLGNFILGSTNQISGQFLRKRGILDLTDAQRIMNGYAEKNAKPYPSKLEDRQKHYISIPALFYHPNRRPTDTPPSAKMWLTQAAIAAFLKKVAKLNRPHDGIVEAASNRLHPEPYGSEPEILYLDNVTNLSTIAPHIETVDAQQEDHVSMTKADTIIKLVYALLVSRTADKSDVLAALAAAFPRDRVHPHRIKFNP